MNRLSPIPIHVFAILVFGVGQFVLWNGLVDPVFLPQYLVPAVTCMVFGYYWAGIKPQKEGEVHLPRLAGIVFLILISLLLASMVQAVSLPTASFELIRWGFMGVLFLTCTYLLQQNITFSKAVIRVLAVSALLQTAIALWTWPTGQGHPIGTQANPNLLGLAFLFSLPFCIQGALLFKKHWRYICLAASLACIAMAYLSGSRTVAVSLVLALVILLPIAFVHLRRSSGSGKRSLLVFFLIIPLLGAAWLGLRRTMGSKVGSYAYHLLWDEQASLTPNSSSLEHRFVLWNKTMDMIEADPVDGVGIGNWKLNIQRHGFQAFDDKGNYGLDVPQRAHNVFLEVTAEGGVLAGAVFLVLFGMAFFRSIYLALRRERGQYLLGGALVVFWTGFFVACCFNFPMERPFHVSLFVFAASLTFLGAKKKKAFKVRDLFLPGVVLAGSLLFFGVMKIGGEMKYKEVKKLKANQDWQQLLRATKDYHHWFSPIDPENGLPLEWYTGMAHLSTGSPSMGVDFMRIAAEKAPHHIAVQANLAAALNMDHKYSEANYTYRELLKIFPDFEEGRLNLAVSLHQSGDAEGARAELKKIKLLKNEWRYAYLAKLFGLGEE